MSDSAFGHNPYALAQNVYTPELLIVGGSSGGTAAAITAGRLGIDTLLVMRAPRDLGGLSTNGINPDSDLPMRSIGGLALELDLIARRTSGYRIPGKHGGEGYFAPFHIFFDHVRSIVDRLSTVTVIAPLYPCDVIKDEATARIECVRFRHRTNRQHVIEVRPKLVIDAEIEGDVTHLAGVTTTLCREGKAESDDPSRDSESYAGHIFTPRKMAGPFVVSGGAPMPESTHAPDSKPATMAWNGSVVLEEFDDPRDDSPWLLTDPPTGYNADDWRWLDDMQHMMGVYVGMNHRRWNADPYLSTLEGWRMPDGRHVLESFDMDDRDANEKAQLAVALCSLYHVQRVLGWKQFGLSSKDFHEGIEPKYRLSDFGTSTLGGDAPLPGLIYMREGRRMVNDQVVGGRLMEDQGADEIVQKTAWSHRSVYFNAMVIDIHGVHKDVIDGAGPEGMQLLRLAGFPKFGAPCIPFDAMVPRKVEATNLLVAAAGAYTHQAYAAFPRMETGRIVQGHACANAAYFILREAMTPHNLSLPRVQLTLLERDQQALVYFDDTLAGTDHFVIDQMLGCRGVPRRNDAGVFQSDTQVTVGETVAHLNSLFVEHTDTPIDASAFKAVTATLGRDSSAIATRGGLLRALTYFCGVGQAQQDWSSLVADWLAAGYLHDLSPHGYAEDVPVTFTEMKAHLFNAAFAMVRPFGPIAFKAGETVLSDTFSRADGPIGAPARGGPYVCGDDWLVEGGKLKPIVDGDGDGDQMLLVNVGRSAYTLSCDVYLEQTTEPASVGLLYHGHSPCDVRRYLATTAGARVHMQWDRLVDGRPTDICMETRPIPRRGMTLTVRSLPDRTLFYAAGRRVRADLGHHAGTGGNLIGVTNRGANASWFDNLIVRA